MMATLDGASRAWPSGGWTATRVHATDLGAASARGTTATNVGRVAVALGCAGRRGPGGGPRRARHRGLTSDPRAPRAEAWRVASDPPAAPRMPVHRRHAECLD